MCQMKLILVSVAGLLMVLPMRADSAEKGVTRLENKRAQNKLVQYVPKPIPCGPEAPITWRYRQEKVLPFYRKLIIDPFKTSGETNQPWASEVLSLLETEYLNNSDAHFTGGSKTWKKAGMLAQKGCTYPLILWMQAMDFQQKGNRTQAMSALKKLDDSLPSTPDRWFLRFLVGVGYRTISPSSANEKLFAQRFAEWVANGGVTKDESRPVYGMLCDLASNQNPTILEALEKMPSIDPWLTLMLRGGVDYKNAWKMRCLCHVNSVTTEELKDFKEGTAMARKAFEEAWRLHPELPNASTMMIEVCGCTGGEDMRLWFDRAVAVEIDRPQPYISYIKYSCPRWGGSVEKLFDFAESCYQTQRHDTRVPFFYVTTLFEIADELKCDLHEIFTRPGVHEKCIEVLTAQAKNTKTPQEVRSLAAELLPVVEYAGGDMKKAIEYNQLLGKPLSKAVYDLAPNEYNHIKIILNGLRGQNATSLIAAEELYRARRYEEALVALTAIRGGGKLGFEEEQYLCYRISCLEMETLFKRGEWIAPTYKHHAPGWFNFNMNWRVAGNGFRTDKEGCQLEWASPLPADVEYEGVFRFIAATGQTSSVCFQLDKFKNNDKPSVNFDYENNTCQVAVRGLYDEPSTASVSVVCEKPEVQFRIISCNNKVSVWLNGKQVIKEQDISKQMRSFRKNGMRHFTLYGTRVAFSDLRMRSADVAATQKSKK